MNITENLYDIISKYGLDLCNSRFKNYCHALKLIQKLSKQYPHNAKMLLLGSEKTDIEFFVNACHCQDWNIERRVVTIRDLEGIDASTFIEYDGVIVVSYYWNLEISYALNLCRIDFTNLYAFFIENDLQIEHDFYKLFDNYHFNTDTWKKSLDYQYFDVQRYVFNLMKAYDLTHLEKVKAFYLKNIIFTLLFIKDFVLAEEYIQEYAEKRYENSYLYQNAWAEIQLLLASIRKKIKSRPQGDIFMFCLDAMEYDEGEALSFIGAQSEKSTVFTNSYTVTPFTQSSLKSMMCSKKVASDQNYLINTIDNQNSPVLSLLQQKDISFFYSGHLPYFTGENSLDACFYENEASSDNYWRCIEKILNSSKPVFCISHELYGSHFPYKTISHSLERYVWEGSSEEAKKIHLEKQHQVSLINLDRQVEFYSDFLSTKCVKIFMSDHGRTVFSRYHTVLKIQGDTIPIKRIDSLFSYLDFHKLVDYIIDPVEEKLLSMKRDYVEIEDVHYYSGHKLASFMKLCVIDSSLLSYHGTVSRWLLYRINYLGEEDVRLLQKMSREAFEQELLLARQRGISYNIDLENDEKFKYSKYVQRVFDRYFERQGDWEKQKKSLIRQLFTEDGLRYAIRGGGEATLKLLLILTREQRNQVHYIIDQNDDCVAGWFGYQVISPKEVDLYPIDHIIMPSLDFRTLFMEELNNCRIRVTDLYTYLENNGILCTDSFFQISLSESDYDVDFPFCDFVDE